MCWCTLSMVGVSLILRRAQGACWAWGSVSAILSLTPVKFDTAFVSIGHGHVISWLIIVTISVLLCLCEYSQNLHSKCSVWHGASSYSYRDVGPMWIAGCTSTVCFEFTHTHTHTKKREKKTESSTPLEKAYILHYMCFLLLFEWNILFLWQICVNKRSFVLF